MLSKSDFQLLYLLNYTRSKRFYFDDLLWYFFNQSSFRAHHFCYHSQNNQYVKEAHPIWKQKAIRYAGTPYRLPMLTAKKKSSLLPAIFFHGDITFLLSRSRSPFLFIFFSIFYFISLPSRKAIKDMKVLSFHLLLSFSFILSFLFVEFSLPDPPPDWIW